MFGTLGFTELLIILAIVILLFGVGKLPKLGRGMGEAIRNFRDSVKSPGDSDEDDDSSS